MHQDLLYIIAEVSVTLAGFSGVVFILGRRSEGKFSIKERNGLFHLLFTTCGNMLVALIVAACLGFAVSEAIAWRIGCGLIALFVLVGVARAFAEERRGEHSLPGPLAWPVPIIALLLALANLAAGLGMWPTNAAVIWVSLSIYLLFVSVCYFASLLVPETPEERSDS